MSRESEIEKLVEVYLSDSDPDRAMYFVMGEIDKWNLMNPDTPIDIHDVQNRAYQDKSAKYD